MKLFLLSLCVITLAASDTKPGKVSFTTQKRVAVNGTESYKVVTQKEEWNPSETAIIICDMWNQHWCKGASERVAELAPKMNQVLKAAREKGFLIVHAPSECMDFYKEYPQRKAAQKYSTPQDEYREVTKLATENNAIWPIDQTNEGCNDTPRCELGQPWKSQIATLEIDAKDIISDSGPEMQRLFTDRGINRVVLMGVHTNMCVVDRPFGMRAMAGSGKKVYLMRDMTDLMYDARAYPYVNHFQGLGLIVEYIEKYIAPTVVSTDLTGEPPFRFKDDPRKMQYQN